MSASDRAGKLCKARNLRTAALGADGSEGAVPPFATDAARPTEVREGLEAAFCGSAAEGLLCLIAVSIKPLGTATT